MADNTEEIERVSRELQFKNLLLEGAISEVDDLATRQPDDEWLRAAHRSMSRCYRAGLAEERDEETIVAAWKEAWRAALAAGGTEGAG